MDAKDLMSNADSLRIYRYYPSLHTLHREALVLGREPHCGRRFCLLGQMSSLSLAEMLQLSSPSMKFSMSSP